MFKLKSYSRKNRLLANKQLKYTRTFMSYFVASLMVFGASSAVPVIVDAAQAVKDNFWEETKNLAQEKVNEEVKSVMEGIENVFNPDDPMDYIPGETGDKIRAKRDKLKKLNDLKNKIKEKIESPYTSDRITALGDLLKALGEEVGEKGPQFEPLGEIISGYGEVTSGIGESLKNIEGGYIKRRNEAIARGDLSPEAWTEDEKARIEGKIQQRLERLEETREIIEELERARLEHECPECIDALNKWNEALNKLMDEEKSHREAMRAFREAVKDYRERKKRAVDSKDLLFVAQERLARARGKYNIMDAESDVRAAENAIRRYNNSKEKVKAAIDQVKQAKTAVENARKADDDAWSKYQDCLKNCKKPDDQSLYLPGYDVDQSQPISTSLGSLTDLNGVRIGNENPEWCKTTDGTPAYVTFDPVVLLDMPLPGTVTAPEGAAPLVSEGPPSLVHDPAGALENLYCQATSLTHMIGDPELNDEEFAAVETLLDDTNMYIQELKSAVEDETEEDPRDVGEPETTQPPEPIVPTVTIYVKAKTDVLVGGQDAAQAIVKRQFKFFSASVEDPALPGDGADKPQTDHDLGPIQGTTDDKGNLTLKVPMTALGVNPPAEQPLNSIGGPAFQVTVDTAPQSSVNVKVAGDDPQIATGGIPVSAQEFLVGASKINGSVFLTFTFPTSMEGSMNKMLVTIPGVVNIEINFCRTKRVTLDDPYFVGKGGWGQSYDDQWAIKRVGFTDGEDSAWNKLGANPQPVIVAVIDSGLDWNHLDFDWKNLWQNPNEIPNNGKDDDGNGYIDDIIGWDFMANSNKPWDHDGHGTIVSGIIAATQNNGIGIAGINPHARIMVCKALNNFGNTRASYLAKAIVYAVDNGAQVINMSVGGENLTQIEQEAVAYAEQNGVLIVVASGNESVNVEGLGLASIDGVLTVASTGLDDKRSVFSNWGSQIDIAAPGIEVLGLRARLTDTMQDIPGVEYVNGASFVGEDNRYYRGSGTSFSAPLVTGIASLVMSKHPEYTGAQVAQILKQSATDIDVPGVDQFSGYGLVNAAAALMADPEYYLEARISQIQGVQEGDNIYLEVVGTAIGSEFKEAWIELGEGETPQSWKKIIVVPQAIEEGRLGLIPSSNFTKPGFWTVRVIVQDREGNTRESRGSVEIE